MKSLSAITILGAALITTSAHAGRVLWDLPDLDIQSTINSTPGDKDRDFEHSDLKTKACRNIPKNLRAMFFENFQTFMRYQKLNKGTVDKESTKLFARALGRSIGESSGDPTCLTLMSGKQVGTWTSSATLNDWKKMQDSIKKLNDEVNFGVLQVSGNRFWVGFPSIFNQSDYNFMLLKNKNKTDTQAQTLFTFYKKIVGVAWNSKNRDESMDNALRFCGTPFLYKEFIQGDKKGMGDIKRALGELTDFSKNSSGKVTGCNPYDLIKNPKTGELKRRWMQGPNKEAQARCFGKWVTLCPNLAVAIGTLQPDKYFDKATRYNIACEDTFQKLLSDYWVETAPRATPFKKADAPAQR